MGVLGHLGLLISLGDFLGWRLKAVVPTVWGRRQGGWLEPTGVGGWADICEWLDNWVCDF